MKVADDLSVPGKAKHAGGGVTVNGMFTSVADNSFTDMVSRAGRGLEGYRRLW